MESPADFRVNTADRFEWLQPNGQLGLDGTYSDDLTLGRQPGNNRQIQGLFRSDLNRFCEPGRIRLRIQGTCPLPEIRVHVVRNGRALIPDTRIPVPAPREIQPAECEIFLIPSQEELGKDLDGARMEAGVRDGKLEVSLLGNGKTGFPKDFGPAWIVVLDAKGEALRAGPLDGGPMSQRTYAEKDLAKPDAGQSLSAAFPVPKDLPKGAYRILVGTPVDDGETWHGSLLTAKPIDLEAP